VLGYLVDCLPPGRQRLTNEGEGAALAAYLDAVRGAQEMDRGAVRAAAADQFATERMSDSVLTALDEARKWGRTSEPTACPAASARASRVARSAHLATPTRQDQAFAGRFNRAGTRVGLSASPPSYRWHT